VAHSLQLARSTADAIMDAFGARFDGGYLRLYAGKRPVNADIPADPLLLLAELRFGRPAFRASADGVIVARSMEAEPLARYSDTATWYRALTPAEVPIVDGTVGQVGGEGFDLELETTELVSGAIVSMISFAYTHPLA